MGGLFRAPDAEARLGLLAESARYDVCLSSCAGNTAGGVGRVRDPMEPYRRWIYPASVPGRGVVGILKILQTNRCANNCSYCAFAVSRDCVRRVTLAPDELADVFMRMVRARLVHGIFISSGVGGGADAAMERVIRTAEVLRRRHRFDDYIHLKVLPGVSPGLVTEAARYATRLSVNLEAPNPASLASIAPDKDFRRDLLLRMKWTAEAVRSGIGAVSHTTQFVVGAAGESDLDILRTVDWIYREMHVYRSYFSAYQPLDAGEGREGERPVADPLLREHRLYQVDFLLRGYGFRFDDIVFDRTGGVPREVDPKTAYAMMHPELYPVDANGAEEAELLKVPGIGPVTARRIVEARHEGTIGGFGELRRLGKVAARAERYLRFPGRSSAAERREWRQLELIPETAQGWRTGLDPLDKDKIRSGTQGARYEYDGQTGRRLYYHTGRSGHIVRCR